MILLLISFVAGILTVLAPCILPLLPIIIGGSVAGGGVRKKKAFTIIVSLGISVVAFTLLLKVSALFITIPEFVWKYLSGGIVIAIGATMLVPSLWGGQLLARLSGKANVLLGSGAQKKSFWGDIIIGASLGPVFSTCSPTFFIVLATVLPVNFAKGLVYLSAYTLGLCISLLAVAFLGQRIMTMLGAAADPHGWVKKGFGILFIIVGIAIISGGDKALQTKILDAGFFDVTTIEQKLLQFQESGAEKKPMVTSDMLEQRNGAIDKSARYDRAIELSTLDGYINTDGKPITLEELRKDNKVVLLDIWTYSCINCRRTIPYLNDWYKKYKDQGLVIVGLHTPEFAFEKDYDNVAKATAALGIEYPVVMDNDFSTWRAYDNQYWPRKYLIDIDGYIVYDHAGEGNYEETEKAIQKALKERADRLNVKTEIQTVVAAREEKRGGVGSPEIYFGAERNEYLGNGTPGRAGAQAFVAPKNPGLNQLYLDGKWNLVPEYAESAGEGKVLFTYKAKTIYMVASADEATDVEIYQDGVFKKTVTIKEDTLYTLMDNAEAGTHTIEIRIPKKGLKAFTFTFG